MLYYLFMHKMKTKNRKSKQKTMILDFSSTIRTDRKA